MFANSASDPFFILVISQWSIVIGFKNELIIEVTHFVTS